MVTHRPPVKTTPVLSMTGWPASQPGFAQEVCLCGATIDKAVPMSGGGSRDVWARFLTPFQENYGTELQ